MKVPPILQRIIFANKDLYGESLEQNFGTYSLIIC